MALTASRGSGVNVAGFLRYDGTDLHAYTSEQSINSDDVIRFFDDFCPQLTEPTVVVLDNASTHRSAAFRARIADWEAAGLTLFFLPTYSPELNRIEIMWRCYKHQWLPFAAYRNIKSRQYNLRKTLNEVGSKWEINFTWLLINKNARPTEVGRHHIWGNRNGYSVRAIRASAARAAAAATAGTRPAA